MPPRIWVRDEVAPGAVPLVAAEGTTTFLFVTIVPAIQPPVFKPLTHLSAGVMAIDTLCHFQWCREVISTL